MATEVTHTYVGQYQYSETEAVMSNISTNFKTMQYDTAFEIGTSTREGETGGLENTMTFTDVSIKRINGGNFNSGVDYYVRVEIPEDNCYDNNFLIKLINDNYTSNSEDYQFIMNYSIPKSASEDCLYSVALYLDPEQNAHPSDNSKDGIRYSRVVALEGSDKDHKDYNQIYLIDRLPSFRPVGTDKYSATLPDDKQEVGKVYFTKDETGEVQLWYCNKIAKDTDNKKGDFTEIHRTQFGIYTMYATWEDSKSSGVGTRVIELLFRPETNNFNQVLFQLVRGVQDYGIINAETEVNGKKVTNYGRKATIKSFEVYEMTNLVNRLDERKPFTRMGIWGHPEQIIGINGEQILIGPSGYYELSDYTINSLSVVAKDFRTGAFTLDYTWQSDDQKER